MYNKGQMIYEATVNTITFKLSEEEEQKYFKKIVDFCLIIISSNEILQCKFLLCVEKLEKCEVWNDTGLDLNIDLEKRLDESNKNRLAHWKARCEVTDREEITRQKKEAK